MTTILNAMIDPQLFGDTFTGPSWETWRAVLAASFALPMTDVQAEIFKRVAGGRERPAKRVSELIAIAGRRSAKTQTAAATAVYLATIGAELDGTLERLSTGERGVIAILAVDRQQAKVAMQYVTGMIEASPIFSGMVERMGKESIDLTNRVSIEVQTSSYRAIRGRTLIAAIFDEAAFWRSEATQSPDLEIYRAAVPALATTGGMLIAISSPYSRRGLIYGKHRKHFGKAGDVLVVQGSTADFNPTLDPAIIENALEDDPEAAKSEWLGQFRSDIASFIQREAVEQCTRVSPIELPHDRKVTYMAFVDPAGGGQDEYTMAICHKQDEQVVIDVLKARRGTPADITREYSQVLKAYGIKRVQGDRYGGTWPGDEFRKHGIEYQTSRKTKSDLYVELLPKINGGLVELPPDQKLLGQLINLERRTSRAGKDSIDHPPGGNDDRANVIAGAVEVARRQKLFRSRTVAVLGGF